MMSKFDLNGTKKRKTIYFGLFIVAALSASVMLSAMAAERAGMYWIGMDLPEISEKTVDNRGFLMVDVSDLSAVSSPTEPSGPETEVIPIGIGPLPSVPSLTTEELKLYGVLSRGDGLILNENKEELIGDICWQEVILEPGDTVDSIAKEYGVSVDDIRAANGLKADEKLSYTDILYIPDSKDAVKATLAYVNKLKKYEAELPVYFIVSEVKLNLSSGGIELETEKAKISVKAAQGSKCPRCWKHKTDMGSHPDHPEVCGFCAAALDELEA